MSRVCDTVEFGNILLYCWLLHTQLGKKSLCRALSNCFKYCLSIPCMQFGVSVCISIFFYISLYEFWTFCMNCKTVQVGEILEAMPISCGEQTILPHAWMWTRLECRRTFTGAMGAHWIQYYTLWLPAITFHLCQNNNAIVKTIVDQYQKLTKSNMKYIKNFEMVDSLRKTQFIVKSKQWWRLCRTKNNFLMGKSSAINNVLYPWTFLFGAQLQYLAKPQSFSSPSMNVSHLLSFATISNVAPSWTCTRYASRFSYRAASGFCCFSLASMRQLIFNWVGHCGTQNHRFHAVGGQYFELLSHTSMWMKLLSCFRICNSIFEIESVAGVTQKIDKMFFKIICNCRKVDKPTALTQADCGPDVRPLSCFIISCIIFSAVVKKLFLFHCNFTAAPISADNQMIRGAVLRGMCLGLWNRVVFVVACLLFEIWFNFMANGHVN